MLTSKSFAATSDTHLQTCEAPFIVVEHLDNLRFLVNELGSSEGIGQVLTDTYYAAWPVASSG